MNEGLRILLASLGIFFVFSLAFLAFGFFVYPNFINTPQEIESEPLPEVLSVVDQDDEFTYNCPENFPVVQVPTDYSTIQDAINAANSGVIIEVASGVYHENIVLKPEICLIAKDFAKSEILGFSGTVIQATDKNRIENFRITSIGEAEVAVSVVDSKEVSISKNAFENFEHGIMVSENSRISVDSCAFNNVNKAIFIEDSEFIIKSSPVQVSSVGLEISSSKGDIIGMAFEGGNYAVRAKDSELFIDGNNFRNQNIAGLELCSEGSYEIGHNFFSNINEEILYKE